MQGKKREVDMLNGPLAGKIVRFALPVAAASILQQLFNSADLAVVGRFDSATAMAAVGSNAALINLIVSLFAGLSLGGTVTVAGLIGSGKRQRVNEAVHTSITLAIVSGLIVCVVGETIAPILLRLMNTPDDVLKLASLYLRIFFLAMPLFLIYDFGSSILRAKGDSARPLIALIASGVVNVVLNIIFVAGFGLGVAGVAIATDIANLVSASLIIYFLRTEEETFRLSLRKLGIRKEYFKKIVAIGAPAGLQGMVFSISNVVIQAAINGFGADAIAGNTAGQNFEYMCYFVIFWICTGGYNLYKPELRSRKKGSLPDDLYPLARAWRIHDTCGRSRLFPRSECVSADFHDRSEGCAVCRHPAAGRLPV